MIVNGRVVRPVDVPAGQRALFRSKQFTEAICNEFLTRGVLIRDHLPVRCAECEFEYCV